MQVGSKRWVRQETPSTIHCGNGQRRRASLSSSPQATAAWRVAMYLLGITERKRRLSARSLQELSAPWVSRWDATEVEGEGVKGVEGLLSVCHLLRC